MQPLIRIIVASLLVGLVSSLPVVAADIKVPADYATIQAAVDAAASGDTIQIAAGVYTEQIVIVRKNLTLFGAPGAVIMAQPGLSPTLLMDFETSENSLLAIPLSDVLASGLTFEGEHLADSETYGSLVGIYCLGASGRVINCKVEGFHGTEVNGGLGIGFLARNPVNLGTPVVNVGVFDSTFADNQTSMVVSGDGDFNPRLLRTRFTIEGNTITGPGLGSDALFLAGIVIGTGAGGEVRQNTIRDHIFIGPNIYYAAFAITAFDQRGFGASLAPVPLQAVRYEGNTFLNNQVHLAAILANGSQFVNNTFQGTGPGPVPIGIGVTGDDILIANNDFSDMPRGIQLIGGGPEHGTLLGITTNPKVIANRFCGVDQPIVIDPLVTGVKEHATKICP